MSDKVFVDTNILVYAHDLDAASLEPLVRRSCERSKKDPALGAPSRWFIATYNHPTANEPLYRPP